MMMVGKVEFISLVIGNWSGLCLISIHFSHASWRWFESRLGECLFAVLAQHTQAQLSHFVWPFCDNRVRFPMPNPRTLLPHQLFAGSTTKTTSIPECLFLLGFISAHGLQFCLPLCGSAGISTRTARRQMKPEILALSDNSSARCHSAEGNQILHEAAARGPIGSFGCYAALCVQPPPNAARAGAQETH